MWTQKGLEPAIFEPALPDDFALVRRTESRVSVPYRHL